MNVVEGANNTLNRGLVNLIFDEVKSLIVKPIKFSFGSNKVLNFHCADVGANITKAIFTFDSKEGLVELTFLAKNLEIEYLNPYLNLDSDI